MNHLELEAYLSQFLNVPLFSDYAPNGIQIEGRSEVKNIATAVTASLEIVQKAKDLNVDALFVHHGYFWKGESYEIRGLKKARILPFLQNDMNLFAYHLPLDVYADWGNNACMGQRMQAKVLKKCAWRQCSDLLWIGQLKNPKDQNIFFQDLKKLYGHQVQAVLTQKQNIQRIAWCSGGAYDLFELAISQSVDAFITGEFSERSYHLAKESQVNFFAAGHHATEKDGIQSLGEYLAKKFGFSHVFIDEDNPF
jgi:dinuclear metal center YbgI/SA1388 family protein